MHAGFPFVCGANNLTNAWLDQYNEWIYTYGYTVWVANQQATELDCLSYTVSPASTRFAIQGSSPSVIQLTGDAPFSSQYGMPKMYVYGPAYNLVATVVAQSVNSSTNSASFPFPSSLAANAYAISLTNTRSDSTQSAAGGNFLSIASSQTIAGNPFGVAVAGQTDSWSDRDSCDRSSSTGSSYLTVPIVSLYSLGKVLVDGVQVSVGVNPTAVVPYAGPGVQTSGSDDCDTYRDGISGMTRALVANSGSKSVTILDVVNDVALSSITVGNQPVALAVSSDGTTAYVANYGDSTLTKVSLSSGTATTTIPLVGKPTSVVLSAAGSLWVGGVGFLTQINPQTMTSVASQNLSARTIVALGFSDAVNRLVATSTNSAGEVFSDNISAATFASSSTYAPATSLQVSSLGTHYNTNAHANVQSFSGTLASSAVINLNQVGAPPLVVQDGWAVITATPTGFSVTDITGNVVLISEQTPSPITAIAVDPNLSVAYLTMPDSNILLTVPLPGVQ
jgi:YVTN family beta-propeller protein